MEGANATIAGQEEAFRGQAKHDKKQFNRLEVDLRRKEKALAETAALLVLRKKPMRSGGARTNDPRRRSPECRCLG